MKLPKTIWTYWHQGFDESPEIVRHCVASWKKHHPGWKINLLDQHSVWEHLDDLEISKDLRRKLDLPHLSDLIRTKLLINYGGVWADPTCYCLKPLEKWLPEYMGAGVFMFHNPGPGRIISNWFIAAEPNNRLLEKLYHELCGYWNNYNFKNLGRPEKSLVERWLERIINRDVDWTRVWFSPLMTRVLRLYPYMVYHFKVYDLICSDDECAEIFGNMKKFPAEIPHKVQHSGLLEPLSKEVRQWIDERHSPLCKLTWKLDSSTTKKGSVLDYLIYSEA